MSLTTHRVGGFRVELLTSTEATLGVLEGVTGGDLKWNANARLPGGGTLELIQTTQSINYSSDRVRIWWEANGEEWPLGVYVMAAPATQYGAEFQSRSITLIDKLTVVADDCLTTTLQVAAGANVIDTVIAQIQATGETRIVRLRAGTLTGRRVRCSSR